MRTLFVLLGLTFIQFEGYAKMPTIMDPQDTFPVPTNIKNQLFYLQRTTNTKHNTDQFAHVKHNIEHDG